MCNYNQASFLHSQIGSTYSNKGTVLSGKTSSTKHFLHTKNWVVYHGSEYLIRYSFQWSLETNCYLAKV